MLSVGQRFPHFSLTGVVSNDLAHAFQPFDQASHPGKWQVVFDKGCDACECVAKQ